MKFKPVSFMFDRTIEKRRKREREREREREKERERMREREKVWRDITL